MKLSLKKKRRISYSDPSPLDLTTSKIKKYMSQIKVGDVIEFYSIAECFMLIQVDRHNTKIPAKGTVVSIPSHRRFVTVELRRGVRESISYFDIEKLNGVTNPGFLKGGDCIDAPRVGRPATRA